MISTTFVASEKRLKGTVAFAVWSARSVVIAVTASVIPRFVRRSARIFLARDNLPAMVIICRTWADDPHPLVQRAAIAGICEPRLLRDGAARTALELCQRITDSLVARTDRKHPDVRTLRKALGYCWSVAVAADPQTGLPMFRVLESNPDPDVRWIVRENLKKKRLASLTTSA